MTLSRGSVIAVAIAVATTAVTYGQGYDKKTIEKMLGDGAKKLASANAAERQQGAGFILGYITCGYKAQYQPLVVKALKDPDPKVRATALQTLEKIAAKEAIPDIAPLLEDPVSDVQERAAYALGTIGDKSAEPFLIKARDAMKAQKKNTMALTMQEGLDEISGKSPTEHTHCP
ncbi:MAG: HEAT repeat domain-containing protein [Vicinamibacterales bacterium]